MTHIEYTLIVAQDLYQSNGSTEALHYKKGDRVTVDQKTFVALKNGETVNMTMSSGMNEFSYINYNKYDFENDVTVLKIITEVGNAKLGQRNKQNK